MDVNNLTQQDYSVFEKYYVDPNANPLPKRTYTPTEEEYWRAAKINKYAYEISISEEGKLLTKQLDVLNLEAEQYLESLTEDEKKRYDRRADLFIHFENEEQDWHLLMTESLYQGGPDIFNPERHTESRTKNDVPPPFSFDALADMHTEIGEELKTKCSGAELEEKLKSLDEEYGKVINDGIERLKQWLTFSMKIDGIKGVDETSKIFFGRSITSLDGILSDIDAERFAPYSDKIDEFTDFLTRLSDIATNLPFKEKLELGFFDTDIDPKEIPDTIKEYLAKARREAAERDTLVETAAQNEAEKPVGTAQKKDEKAEQTKLSVSGESSEETSERKGFSLPKQGKQVTPAQSTWDISL